MRRRTASHRQPRGNTSLPTNPRLNQTKQRPFSRKPESRAGFSRVPSTTASADWQERLWRVSFVYQTAQRSRDFPDDSRRWNSTNGKGKGAICTSGVSPPPVPSSRGLRALGGGLSLSVSTPNGQASRFPGTAVFGESTNNEIRSGSRHCLKQRRFSSCTPRALKGSLRRRRSCVSGL